MANLQWPNGDHYEGETILVEDENDDFICTLSGKGKMTYNDGSVYEGDWANNKKKGIGKMTYADGRVEDGRWENDKFLGR